MITKLTFHAHDGNSDRVSLGHHAMSLGAKVLRGSMFMLAVSILQRGLGLLSTLILARLLLPSDFGVIAIAMVAVFLADTFADSGARQYLVQRPEIDDDVVATAWSLDILMKAAAALLLLILLPVFSRLWSDPDAVLAIAVLAPTIVLRALQSPQLHVDIRNLEYRNVAFVETIQRIVSFCIVVLIALWLRSWWAIVIGYYAGSVTAVALSWIRTSWPLKFSLSRVREQWQFSGWILSRAFLGYLRAQTDSFIIARYFPMAQLGQFTVSRDIAVMPVLDIIQPLTQPLLSSLSRARDDPPAAARQIRIAVLVIAIVTMPMGVFLYRYGDVIALVLLGERWLDAGQMMAVMAPMIFSYSVGGITNNLFVALGRVQALFVYDLCSLLILVSVMLYFRNSDITTIILARGVTGLVVTGTVFVWIASTVGVRIIHVFLLCGFPALIAASTVYSVPEFDELVPLTQLMSYTLMVGMFYLVSVLLFARFVRGYSTSWLYLLDLIESLWIRLVGLFLSSNRKK